MIYLIKRNNWNCGSSTNHTINVQQKNMDLLAKKIIWDSKMYAHFLNISMNLFTITPFSNLVRYLISSMKLTSIIFENYSRFPRFFTHVLLSLGYRWWWRKVPILVVWLICIIICISFNSSIWHISSKYSRGSRSVVFCAILRLWELP